MKKFSITVYILLFVLQGHILFGTEKFQLSSISIKDGLSNMNVNAITQDELGYIWIATMRGLNRYNGYEFKQYFLDSSDSTSLRSNHVFSLFYSKEGLLYIGTLTGIDCYNNRYDKIMFLFRDFNKTVLCFAELEGFIYVGTSDGLYRFKPNENHLKKLGLNHQGSLYISSLLFDTKGHLWCGLDNEGGLALYNKESDNFDFFLNIKEPDYLISNNVRTIFQADENLLMIGTNDGIEYFDTKTRKYIDPKGFSRLSSGLKGVDVRFIIEKEPSIYWIGTYQNGIYFYDKGSNSLVHHSRNDGYSDIHSNAYQCHFKDKEGNIWFGTFDSGLDVCYRQAENFNFDIQLNNLTQGKFVTGILQDKKKNFIITFRESDFCIYNSENKTQGWFNQQNSTLSYSFIRSIYIDSENKYWIGNQSGLQIFYPEGKAFKTLKIPEPNNGAVSIMQFKDRIFVGTDRQGLLVFDLQGNLLEHHLEFGSNIPSIVILNDKELLFVSYGYGLFVMDLNNSSAKKVDLADPDKYRGLLYAITVHVDKNDKIWLGTYNYGLYAIDFKKSEVLNFNSRKGLPSNDIVGIEEDDDNNLWLSTSFGLAKFNKASYNIKKYFFNEGVNNYQFHAKASYKDEQGIIYFGGNSGLTYFNPIELNRNKSNPSRVVLENLFVNNHLVIPSFEKSILTESLPYTKKITLNYKVRLFSIDFVAFDFLSPGKMQYYYILEGFDKNWSNIGTQHRVSYSNLSRGHYLFKVKALNDAEIWSENEAELMIRVKPAPWFSIWAVFLYLIIIVAIIVFIFRLRIKTFMYKKNLEIEYSEHLREHEVNAMKQKFFANISHELRTPLTIIYGLVSQLSRHQNLSPQIKEYSQNLHINVTRLLKLITQLLEYKKIESESLTLWLKKGNVNEAIRQILEPFILYSKDKDIRIDFLEGNNFIFYFDIDKLEKILTNLLSNAIKYTEKGGRIEVVVKKRSGDQLRSFYKTIYTRPEMLLKEYVEISVTDNGTGIDEKEWATIFDRYKQVESNGKKRYDYSGTGIGLNFTKSLIEIHKGHIRMDSKIGQGTTFAFILPYDSSDFEPKDFADSAISEKELICDGQVLFDNNSAASNEFSIQPDFEKTILIVEDNLQMNKFLINVLKDYYKTVTAFDGDNGLKMIKEQLPDIVISDVLMPVKDGYKLTQCVKENRELCHIPVILLTAMGETPDQIAGMQSGADFYITKPFNTGFLLSAIDSLLKNRNRIHKIFLSGQMPKLDKSEINQHDILFLSKLNSFLEKELANPDLDIFSVAQNMNMSRSVFYRKFVGLTSLSPISYIKKYRINKSVELIKTGNYALYEVTYLTGFSSPSYFSTAFKQEKGISPREFISRVKAGTYIE